MNLLFIYLFGPIAGLFVSCYGLLTRSWFSILTTMLLFKFTGNPYSFLALVPFLGFVIHWLSIKWDTYPSPGGDGGDYSITIRGDGRFLKSIYQTPDERYPGGLNEPTVRAWLSHHGKWICSFLWAGERNVAMGLARLLGHETVGYLPDVPGFTGREDAWKFQWGYFSFGWNVVRLLDGRHWAVPLFTIKKP